MLENNEEQLEKSVNEEVKKVEENQEEATNKVVEEVDKTDDNSEIPMLDYDSMDLQQLVVELSKLIKSNPVHKIKENIDAIKNAFNAGFGELIENKKEEFLSEGGNLIDFHYSSPIKTEYNNLLSDYKKKRDAYYEALELQLKENLKKRNAIIDELKLLIDNADPKTMYNEYKDLNERWKAIGAVPKTRYNDIWKVYHHHVERFYDLLHLNKDFRELDFKHNLEEKLKLILRAEALVNNEDVNLAFKELQDIHRIWKEDIGPVGKEYRESVWQRFSEATKKIHNRRHEYFRELKSKYQEIIDAKLEVVAEINAYDTSKNKTHKDWQKSIKDIEALRKKYFDLGKLPYNKSEAVWQKLKKATQKFNSLKNAFYKEEKTVQNDNLNKKKKLIELAESLKDSEDWDKTTDTMKRIQADWRKIGHVPHKFSDTIWKQFKDACNYYFDRLHARKEEFNKEQQETVEAKKAFLDNFKVEDAKTLEDVQKNIAEWRELGYLPKTARNLDRKFNKLIDLQLEKLNLDRSDIEMIKFKNEVDDYLGKEDFRKIDNLQFFIRKKIDETVREMQQLENNLSFISNATEDNPLVKNVREGIQKFKDKLDIWQLKLDYLKKLDY
ncbi:MAG: DUF349 domain-containing protein [Tenacibaculum sp.]|nr:DUF349 domain-containing protein [Tenacibaculum sp.]